MRYIVELYKEGRGLSGPIEAVVSLKSEGASVVGQDRVRLLEAVARAGSIAAGAREVGLTYKAAWDAISATTNLFGRPLLATQTGGRAGGGATLTPTGIRVIEAYRRLEAEMARVLRVLEPELAGSGVSAFNLMSGFLMKTSARNALRGTVTAIASDSLSSEVSVAVSDDTTIQAHITNESVRALGLVVGREATVLIKASFVIIASGRGELPVSVRNCIAGEVVRCESSPVSAEVVLDIGGGKTLAATITASSVRALNIRPGDKARALFDAAHVIVAID